MPWRFQTGVHQTGRYWSTSLLVKSLGRLGENEGEEHRSKALAHGPQPLAKLKSFEAMSLLNASSLNVTCLPGSSPAVLALHHNQ